MSVKETWKPKMVVTKETLTDISEYPFKGLETRGLTKETCEHFGVRVGVSTTDGKTVEAIYFPMYKNKKLVAYQKKDLTLPKDDNYHFTFIGKVDSQCDLFGQDVAPTGGKKSYTHEGALDAMASWQVMKDKYSSGNPACVAVVSTSWAVKQVANQKEFYDKFQDNVFVFDQDQCTLEELKKGVIRGKEATQAVAQLMPNILVASFSEKDANEMLLQGKEDELYWALVSKCKQFKPQGFVTVDDIFDEATTMPTWGRPWPWPSLTKLTYGRRDGEGMYLGAGVKVGKSEAVNQIAQYDTQVLGDKIALFKLEEKPAMTARKIAGKIMHKQFHIPDGDFSQQELIEGINLVRKGILLYDSYGATSWDNLKAAIRYAVVVEGVKTVIIDPLTRMTTGMEAAAANTELERIADEISKMAIDLKFFYMFFCHLKAPQSGKSHEEGGTIHSNQFTGSRAMMRACHYMIGIQRDKSLEDEIEKNTSTFVLLEDRVFGRSGKFSVFYNNATGDYLEPEHSSINF